jgi:hypothetical protein
MIGIYLSNSENFDILIPLLFYFNDRKVNIFCDQRKNIDMMYWIRLLQRKKVLNPKNIKSWGLDYYKTVGKKCKKFFILSIDNKMGIHTLDRWGIKDVTLICDPEIKSINISQNASNTGKWKILKININSINSISSSNKNQESVSQAYFSPITPNPLFKHNTIANTRSLLIYGSSQVSMSAVEFRKLLNMCHRKKWKVLYLANSDALGYFFENYNNFSEYTNLEIIYDSTPEEMMKIFSVARYIYIHSSKDARHRKINKKFIPKALTLAFNYNTVPIIDESISKLYNLTSDCAIVYQSYSDIFEKINSFGNGDYIYKLKGMQEYRKRITNQNTNNIDNILIRGSRNTNNSKKKKLNIEQKRSISTNPKPNNILLQLGGLNKVSYPNQSNNFGRSNRVKPTQENNRLTKDRTNRIKKLQNIRNNRNNRNNRNKKKTLKTLK